MTPNDEVEDPGRPIRPCDDYWPQLCDELTESLVELRPVQKDKLTASLITAVLKDRSDRMSPRGTRFFTRNPFPPPPNEHAEPPR